MVWGRATSWLWLGYGLQGSSKTRGPQVAPPYPDGLGAPVSSRLISCP